MAAAGAHLLIRAAFAVLLVAALAGCGGAARSNLEDSAEATAAETSRFELQLQIVDPAAKGQRFELDAEGAFDYPNERGVMTIGGVLPFVSKDIGPTEFRLLGRTGYARWAIKGKSYWVKDDVPEKSDDPVELLIPFPGSPTKPTDVLARAVRASDEHEELGTETVRGEETTHYRLRVDLEELVKQLPPPDRPEPDVESYWGARYVPVEIWIDDDSRLRRITIRQSSKEENETGKQTTTVELFDYGVEVDVEPPPEEELISQAELNELTGDLGLSREAGEVSSPDEVCESARASLPKKEAKRLCAEIEEKQ